MKGKYPYLNLIPCVSTKLISNLNLVFYELFLFQPAARFAGSKRKAFDSVSYSTLLFKTILDVSYTYNSIFILCRSQEVYVGVAHHVGVIQPYGLLDLPIVYITRLLTEFHWIDAIQDHLDYCGINYYGQVKALVSFFLSLSFSRRLESGIDDDA